MIHPFSLQLAARSTRAFAIAKTVGFILCLAVSPAIATAQSAASRSQLDVKLGLEQHFRLGAWTPIQVTGVADETLSIRCTDPAGTVVQFAMTRSGDAFLGSIQIANPQSRCMLVAGESETPIATFVPARVGFPHTKSDRIWAVPDAGLGFDLAVARRNESVEPQDRATLVAISSLEGGEASQSGVSAWSGQELDDALAVANVLFVTDEIPVRLRDPLRKWVAKGGHLVIDAGGLAPAGDASELGWLPVTVLDQARFRDLNSLETAIPGGRGLRLDEPLTGFKISGESAVSEIKSSFGPIILRTAYGFGRVTGFALPLEAPVLQRWDSLDILCLYLADELPPVQADSRNAAKRLTSVGVTEFETQFLSTVDSADGLGRERPELWTLLGRLILYAIVIGGIDFVLVHKVLQRPLLTWLTMPVIALGCFFLAIQSASDRGSDQSARDDGVGLREGSDLLSLRSLTLVDHDAKTARIDGRNWSSLGSRERTKLTAVVGQRLFGLASGESQLTAILPPRLGWAAVPEVAFGGLYRDARVEPKGLTYRSDAERTELAGLPFNPRGTRLLQTEWGYRLEGDGSLIDFDLALSGTRPVGTLTNRFPKSIDNWLVVSGRTLFRPREPVILDVAESFTVDLQTCEYLSLRDALNGIRRRTIKSGDNIKSVRTVAERTGYDPTSDDLLRAIATASFYSNAGGLEYTGIRASGSPGGFDLSHLLPHDRVILIGRLRDENSPVELRADGRVVAGESATFVRVVGTLDSRQTEFDRP